MTKIKPKLTFRVEIRTTDGAWFIAYGNGRDLNGLTPAKADEWIAKFRADGFAARGVMEN